MLGVLYFVPDFIYYQRDTAITTQFSSRWSLFDLMQLRVEERDLPGKKVVPESTEAEFWKYYDFSLRGYELYTGGIKSSSGMIAYSLFLPDKEVPGFSDKIYNTKFPVLFVHGYLDHAALNKELIEHLVSKGRTVVVFDLPGHGRSDGFRATIDQFDRYGVVLDEMILFFNDYFSKPLDIVGHSTGCAAILQMLNIETLRAKIDDTPETIHSIVLAAPLVRTHLWQMTRAIRGVSREWLDIVPRRYSGSSADEAYLEKVGDRDILGTAFVPGDWSDANALWLEHFMIQEKLTNRDVPFYLFQGEEDTVVDYEFNIKLLKEKNENIEVFYFPGAKHGLFHEKEEYLQPVLFELDKVLGILK